MIRFDHVTKRYAPGAAPALDDVSLEIARGEFAFVVGKSGSGKSTLMRIALREQMPTDGEVMVAGHELRQMSSRQVPRLRREMGAVFQDFRLLPGKTVTQNVAFALQVIGKPRHAIRTLVPETLEMVGLADITRAHAAQRPDVAALVYEGRTTTYGALDEASSRVANGLIAEGIKPGTRVARGAPLLVMEAMKMEHTLQAPADGTVVGYRVRSGEQVGDGVVLVDFSAE